MLHATEACAGAHLNIQRTNLVRICTRRGMPFCGFEPYNREDGIANNKGGRRDIERLNDGVDAWTEPCRVYKWVVVRVVVLMEGFLWNGINESA